MSIKIHVRTYDLKPIALEAEETKKWLDTLEQLNYGDHVILQAKERLLDLFYLSKGEKRFLSQHEGDHILEGLQKMFRTMESNLRITSAPRDEIERKAFYEKLAKGYKLLGDIIQEEYNLGKMDQKDLYSCLDTIGDGGHACASRWRQVLEEMIIGFSDKLKNKEGVEEVQGDKLNNKLKELFFKARVIESNRASKDFVDKNYPNLGEATKLHFETFFKRVLNVLYNYNIPTSQEQDDYLGKSQHVIGTSVQRYLEMVDLNNDVVRRFVALFKEKIKEDVELFQQVVDFGKSVYFKKDMKKQYEDVSEYLSEKVFCGFSTEIREDALREILLEKKFIEPQQKVIDVEKIMLESMEDRDLRLLEKFLKRLPEKAFQNEYMTHLLNLKNSHHETLLMRASSSNMIPFSRFLIQNGANLEEKNNLGSTALMICTENGNAEIAKLLLENGANFYRKNNYGKNILSTCAFLGRTEIAKLVIEKGANPDMENARGQTPLMVAAGSGHLEIAQYLIQKGAKIDQKDHRKNTAIVFAAYNGNIEIVKLLIEKGADLSGEIGRKSIKFAQNNDHKDIAKMIKEEQKARVQQKMLKDGTEPRKSIFSFFKGLGA
jgi:ankyrin repeat protein